MLWLLAVKKKKLLHLHQHQQLKQHLHQQQLQQLKLQQQLHQQLMLSQLTQLQQHQQLTLSQLTQHQQNNQLIIEKADLMVGFFYVRKICGQGLIHRLHYSVTTVVFGGARKAMHGIMQALDRCTDINALISALYCGDRQQRQ